MNAIFCKNLSFGYAKGDYAIQNASFSIEENEFVGIIGPNGGGKTTLLKLLMGFLSPWEGELSIFGRSPTSYPNAISYVPQQLRFDRQFPITVLELILAGRLSTLSWSGRFSKKDHQIAIEMLEKVNLVDFAEKPFGSLSGGQMQRALIARALATEPKILLLDEPTAHVDQQAQEEIYKLLILLQKEMTLLMVTHDIRAIIHNVQRVITVQCSVEAMNPKTLCEHFALGLYHYPLIETKQDHLIAKTGFPL
jgi:zinc transport system ATP-binding protein